MRTCERLQRCMVGMAKALYLQSLLGEPTARERSLEVLENAIRRGGLSAWFNRMRDR